MHTISNSSSRRGFTVLEVLIGATVLALLLGAVGWVVVSSRGAFQTAVVDSELDVRARRALDRIADQMADAGEATLNPPTTTIFGTAQMDYRRCIGNVAANPTWSPTDRLICRIDQGEVDNGLDDDSDGLVDECEVVILHEFGTPNERAEVLCSNVREYLEGEVPNGADDNGNGLIDERGLSLSLAGDVLTLRLCLERRDTRGRISTRTVQTAIRLRN